MKFTYFTNLYSPEEFKISCLIKDFIQFLGNKNHNSYLPYQINLHHSHTRFFSHLSIGNQKIEAYFQLQSLKLNYAIQIWNIACKLVEEKYPHYLKYQWVKQKAPHLKLTFTDKHRAAAEQYFWETLIALCESPIISSSERVHFSKDNDNRLLVSIVLDEDDLNSAVCQKVSDQYKYGKTHYPLELHQKSYSFEEIKHYFIHCNHNIISLLNAKESIAPLTGAERKLFEGADNLSWDTIQQALAQGANINAVNNNGETAFCELFATAVLMLEDNPTLNKNQLIAQTIDIADKMIAMGADIDYFGFEGINALMHTSYQHQPTLMKYLLDKGANPNINYFAFEGDTATSSVLDNLCYDENHSDISPSEKEEISLCIALLKNAGAVFE